LGGAIPNWRLPLFLPFFLADFLPHFIQLFLTYFYAKNRQESCQVTFSIMDYFESTFSWLDKSLTSLTHSPKKVLGTTGRAL
jgi:hypothetical protein